MPDLVAQRERPIATPAEAAIWEMDRMRRRMEWVEARLDAPRPKAAVPPRRKAGRFLPVMAGMGVTALALIAGSLLWQVTHPVPPGQPTIVVNAPAPASAPPNGTPAASPHMPSFRAPGLVLPPRPVSRRIYSGG